VRLTSSGGAVLRKRTRPSGVSPDINVTPLVDVVLVLLIIFMVVAPRMDQDVPVDLPGIFFPDPEVEAAMDPLKLSVATKGEYYIGEQKYDLEGAIAALEVEHANDPLRRLVLRGDSHLKYGDVREILSRAQQVGFPGLSFMVGERHRPGSREQPSIRERPSDDDPSGPSGDGPPAAEEG
jgi:biopolymer transport protein ExbD/biopolymer transport protein TolR